MSEKHLKPYQHYSDLYDKFTVEECRRMENYKSSVPLPKINGKEATEEQGAHMMRLANELSLYFLKGERYLKKRETIHGWMSRDKEIDGFVESVKAPEDICCLTCGRLTMVSEGSLSIGYDGQKHRMLYFYECPLGHLPHRAFYDNGEEHKHKYHHCPKCQAVLDEKVDKEKNKIITFYTCPDCGHEEKDEYDLSVSSRKEKADPNFLKDRDRFCLTEEEGQKYYSQKINLESLTETFKKMEERQKNKEVYDEVANIKKLTIIELEKLIVPELEKAQYVKFHMKDPEVGKDLFVPFVVYDGKSDRSEYDSKHNLQKLLNELLNGTNWRLMSSGVNYRLGMLEGRLRAYEREEDLVGLVQKPNKTKKDKIA